MGVSGHHVPVWYDESSGPANGQGVFWNATTGRFEPADVDTSALDTAGLATDAELAAGLATKEDSIPPGTYVAYENVLKHGAVGDGVTDATAAIQAAINALPLNTADTGVLTPKGFANGGTVYLPRGRYVVSSTINLRRGIRIVGDGRESTQIISKTTGSVLSYLDAGRYIQDEIVVENLSIWQDASVVPTGGAGIEVGFGPSTVQSTKVICRNVFIEGTYIGYRHEAGVGSSYVNCDAQKCVSHGFDIRYTDGVKSGSTTSTAFIACYASLNGGDGFHVTRGGYLGWVATASDSNTGYGYYLEDGISHHIQGGCEENVAGGVYLKNTLGVSLALHIVHNLSSGLLHGVSLDNADGTTLVGGYFFGGASVTGYGVHQVLAGGRTTVLGTRFGGTYVTNNFDFVHKLLNIGSENGLVGNAKHWAVGADQQPDTAATFNIGGSGDSTTDSSLKVNTSHTAAGAVRNAAAYLQAITANTAVTYPLVVGLFVPTMTKGAASTVTRQAGVYAVESSAGGTANAGVMLDAGAGTVPAGNWAIYSDSLRDSVLKGPLRMGSGTGPKWQSGAGTPEGVVTAPIGSLFSRTDGGAGTSLYVKESGAGNTGWVAK